MTDNKKEYKPNLVLEEIDFKKPVDETPQMIVDPLVDKKTTFFKDLKKDISFISVVSIALFAVLGNISVYMWKTHPSSITYIPKQINIAENNELSSTAYKAAQSLMNFDSTTINNSNLKNYFYKNNFEQWQSILKQIGLFDKVVNNKGTVQTELYNINVMSKVIVHGMLRNILTIEFTQNYSDTNEKTITQGKLVLTMIENPDQENQFLISNTHVFFGDSTSTLLK